MRRERPHEGVAEDRRAGARGNKACFVPPPCIKSIWEAGFTIWEISFMILSGFSFVISSMLFLVGLAFVCVKFKILP